MSKLIRNGRSFQVIIPKGIIERFSWGDKTRLFINADPYNRKVIIEEIKG